MPETSISFFSNNIFYPFKDYFYLFSLTRFVATIFFNFGKMFQYIVDKE